MNNITRFLIGLLVAFGILAGIGTILFLIGPVLLKASILFFIIWGMCALLFLILGFFVLIWYLSREEPKKKDNKNYSIKQGRSR